MSLAARRSYQRPRPTSPFVSFDSLSLSLLRVVPPAAAFVPSAEADLRSVPATLTGAIGAPPMAPPLAPTVSPSPPAHSGAQLGRPEGEKAAPPPATPLSPLRGYEFR